MSETEPSAAAAVSKKTISKPVCTGTWLWRCHLCKKHSVIQKNHEACFRTYCRICEEQFEDMEKYVVHCKQYHSSQFCDRCKVVVMNMSDHKCGT